MDLTTNNKQEEFQTLHPSLQTYFTAGIDTNPYGNKLVSQNNFFNFDLFNNENQSTTNNHQVDLSEIEQEDKDIDEKVLEIPAFLRRQAN